MGLLLSCLPRLYRLPCGPCFALQKLAQVSAASEEERKRLEAQYRDRIQQFDEKLRDVSGRTQRRR